MHAAPSPQEVSPFLPGSPKCCLKSFARGWRLQTIKNVDNNDDNGNSNEDDGDWRATSVLDLQNLTYVLHASPADRGSSSSLSKALLCTQHNNPSPRPLTQ